MGNKRFGMQPPTDRRRIMYMTIMFHGLGTLIAWNMFVTAKDYFVKHKLGNAPVYANNFLAYVAWCSQTPNWIFSWLNVFVRISGDLSTRIIWSLSIEIILFVITIVLAMVDSSSWPGVFFWITMVKVFILNVCNAIFQNSVFGVAARLPPSYTGILVLGTSVCGNVVVLLSWLSSYFPDLRTAAIYYFIGGMFVLVVCLDTFIALPLNRYYRYYDMLQQNAVAATNQNAPAEGWFLVERNVPFRMIARQAVVQLYNVFMIFFVTLALFPSVLSDIQPVTKGFLGNHFVLLTCYFTLNFTVVVGNTTAAIIPFPGPRLLVVFTTIRLMFIPIFLMCNYQPVAGRSLPVLINNDWVYWLMVALVGWSSGHCSSLAMMYIGGTVAPENAVKAGMMGGAMIITGVISGISFTFLCPIIVS